MKIKLLIVLLVLTGSLIGQDTTRVVKLKTYWNAEVSDDGFFTESDTYLSFGISLKSLKNNFHEIELRRLNINSSSDFNIDQSMVSLILNYEYNVRFFKNSKKINYYLGVGGSPYLSLERSNPRISTVFPSSTAERGLMVSVIPRLQFRLNKKIGFEIKSSIGLVSFDSYTINVENPTVPVANRKFSNSYFSSAFGAFSQSSSRMSFGINYKI